MAWEGQSSGGKLAPAAGKGFEPNSRSHRLSHGGQGLEVVQGVGVPAPLSLPPAKPSGAGGRR